MRYIQSILEIHVNTLIGKFICQKKKYHINIFMSYILIFELKMINENIQNVCFHALIAITQLLLYISHFCR